jgi:hypothetical protein
LARLAAVMAVIDKLDRPSTAGGSGGPGGNIFVVYLKNADATKLAQVLRAAYGGSSGGGSTGSAGRSKNFAAELQAWLCALPMNFVPIRAMLSFLPGIIHSFTERWSRTEVFNRKTEHIADHPQVGRVVAHHHERVVR